MALDFQQKSNWNKWDWIKRNPNSHTRWRYECGFFDSLIQAKNCTLLFSLEIKKLATSKPNHVDIFLASWCCKLQSMVLQKSINNPFAWWQLASENLNVKSVPFFKLLIRIIFLIVNWTFKEGKISRSSGRFPPKIRRCGKILFWNERIFFSVLSHLLTLSQYQFPFNKRASINN